MRRVQVCFLKKEDEIVLVLEEANVFDLAEQVLDLGHLFIPQKFLIGRIGVVSIGNEKPRAKIIEKLTSC